MLENNSSHYENAESKISNSGENIIIVSNNLIKNSNNNNENNNQFNINFNYNKDYYYNKITNTGNENNRYNQDKIIKIYEILKKIWTKRQFRKLINNFKSKIKDEAIKREIMRMALLKWRFIKGYGEDKYGIIYDRNGKKIREKRKRLRKKKNRKK